MNVQPYLSFEGRAQEAIDFYKGALGATVDMVMHFKDAPPEMQMSPESKDKIMHAAFRIGETAVMASDGFCTGKPEFKGFSLSITAKTEVEADKIFNALADGGQVRMPLTKTFFSPRFGMVADKFGVGWMVINPKPM